MQTWEWCKSPHQIERNRLYKFPNSLKAKNIKFIQISQKEGKTIPLSSVSEERRGRDRGLWKNGVIRNEGRHKLYLIFSVSVFGLSNYLRSACESEARGLARVALQTPAPFQAVKPGPSRSAQSCKTLKMKHERVSLSVLSRWHDDVRCSPRVSNRDFWGEYAQGWKVKKHVCTSAHVWAHLCLIIIMWSLKNIILMTCM